MYDSSPKHNPIRHLKTSLFQKEWIFPHRNSVAFVTLGIEDSHMSSNHSAYNILKDYEWNYAHVPSSKPHISNPAEETPGKWTYAGLPVRSPLAIAAGPLLNSEWVKFYAERSFDILTYKTVRRCSQASYKLPNLVPIEAVGVHKPGASVRGIGQMTGSWAVSFGMPSREPKIWRADIASARQCLESGQILSVSVVATPEKGDDLKTIGEDYASCARWAFESGADVVELNFSCPNVKTPDGMLYTQPAASKDVLCRVRDLVGNKPLLVKLGFVGEDALARSWVKLSEGLVEGLVMINCIGAKVQSADGKDFFSGESRGIAGVAISEAVRKQVITFQSLIREHRSKLKTIAVGGVKEATDVSDYLKLGVEGVQTATAAMLNPSWAVSVKSELQKAYRAQSI